MKENSIEEALKKLSTVKKIKIYELLRTFKREGIENFVTTRKKYIDVILSDYKRVLKENEELKEKLETEQNERLLCHIREKQMIPVQKIKDKIEELNKKEKEELKGMKGQDRYFVKQTYQNKRMILQELLESEE